MISSKNLLQKFSTRPSRRYVVVEIIQLKRKRNTKSRILPKLDFPSRFERAHTIQYYFMRVILYRVLRFPKLCQFYLVFPMARSSPGTFRRPGRLWSRNFCSDAILHGRIKCVLGIISTPGVSYLIVIIAFSHLKPTQNNYFLKNNHKRTGAAGKIFWR